MTSARILIIEDDPITAGLLETLLTAEQFHVTQAADGQEAWDLLRQRWDGFEAIVLDRRMPRMDGLTLLRKLHEGPDPCRIPVIMATSLGDPAQVQEGLQAGAYYYLAKPLQPKVLLAIVRAAVAQHLEVSARSVKLRTLEQGQAFLTHATFQFRTHAEGAVLAGVLASLCPDPERSVLGLIELLYNAVEHGNLNLTYAEKARLMVEDRWFEEVARRQALPENQAKTVDVRFERMSTGLCFTVQDMGAGFDWHRYLDFDPERLFDPNGRGIAIARHECFDELCYLGNGNTVRATLRTSA